MPQRISAPVSVSLINALQPGDIIHDTKLAGFGARRQKNAISYFVKLRHKGKQLWITIGRHGQATPEGNVWTPDTARRQAIKFMGNPEAAERAKPAVAAATLFASVAEQFLALHGAKLKPRTLEEQQRIMRLHLNPALGDIDIADITRTHVETLHARMKSKPRAANHTLAVLSSLMNWAEEHGYRPRDSNPCRRVVHYPQNNRERFLQPDELARLGTALDQAERENLASLYAIAAIRLLIFTGARLSEILTVQRQLGRLVRDN